MSAIELLRILAHFGYEELKKGKTGGSRVIQHLIEKGYLKDE
jgi:hypothetical protein